MSSKKCARDEYFVNKYFVCFFNVLCFIRNNNPIPEYEKN